MWDSKVAFASSTEVGGLVSERSASLAKAGRVEICRSMEDSCWIRSAGVKEICCCAILSEDIATKGVLHSGLQAECYVTCDSSTSRPPYGRTE